LAIAWRSSESSSSSSWESFPHSSAQVSYYFYRPQVVRIDAFDGSIPTPHMKLEEHIFKVRLEYRLPHLQCIILLEHNATTQATMVANHVYMNASSFPKCLFLTFGRAKLAQGATTRIPGITTSAATKASMVQYIRLGINPMPLVDNSVKLCFSAGLKKQFCHYRRTQGQKDSDMPTVFDSLLSQLARFMKKVDVRNGVSIVSFTGKPDKDDMVIGTGLSFLVAYTLVSRSQALANGSQPQYLSWGEICEFIHPGDITKQEYINQVGFR